MGTRAARWIVAVAAIGFTASTVAAQEMATIRPGMTFDEVKSVFGEPAAIRNYDAHTFYFYQNGVEREYGTADIVFFLDGQVVDAVLRSTRRGYAGESSSPIGTTPRPTPRGTRLNLPGEVESVEVRTAPAPIRQEPQPEETDEPAPVEAMDEAPPAEAMDEAPPAEAMDEDAPAEAMDETPAGGVEETVVLLEAFEEFIPVCEEAFRESGMIRSRDARPLCRCTATESQRAGVEQATIRAITEALRTDPSALSQDERVQAAGTMCVDRMMESGPEGGAA